MRYALLVFLVPAMLWAQKKIVTENSEPHKPDNEILGTIKDWQGSTDDFKISLPVTKFQLKNGLTVLLLEDHTVPMISYHTWYRVGSRDEAEGVTGAAHMLEHMMFKGAKKYTGKQFDQLMNINGIQHNAFTNYDYTGFYQNLPSSKLELIMDVEFDRLSSLALNPSDLLSERDVVKEERRWRVDNNPRGLLFENTMAQVFQQHPYRWPVIGTMKDISQYEVQTLRKFYNGYYGPNNAVLVIAGDFDSAKVKGLVEKYYSQLPSRPVPQVKFPTEPVQTQSQKTTLAQEVQNISFNVAFQGFSVTDADMYALDLASYILGAGSSSRLYRNLVYKKQWATSAESFHFSMRDNGIFNVGVSLKPGLKADKALAAVEAELTRLRSEKVTAQELKKAKTLAMKSFVDNLQSLDGKARALAAAEITSGSYETLLTDLDRYNKVTAEDIQRVARQMLKPTQQSVVILKPQDSETP